MDLSWFWAEKHWLPNNITWETFTSNETIRYPQMSELRLTLLYGLIMLAVRLAFESFILIPIGHVTGYSDSKRGMVSKILEHSIFLGFASKSRTKRVLECAFRFTFYTVAFIYGVKVLYDKPWLWDPKQCWAGYPHHNVPTEIWWYYVIETSFYWCLLISSVFDIKRSDFRELFIHHLVTIGLLSISWSINFVRVGTLILVSHDAADVFLEVGKLFRYARYTTATSAIFVAFLSTWIVTRLGYFPFVVVRSALFDAPKMIQPSFQWETIFKPPVVPRIILGMLVALQILHIFWTFIIGRIVVKTLREGDVEDVRSDSEDDEEKPQPKKKPVRAKKRD